MTGGLRATLVWRQFPNMVAARAAFPAESCIYVQADPAGVPVRVGMASEGLVARYRGGTGWALDAAAHGSSNLVYVAAVPQELCSAIEASLIWEHRDSLPYNNQGKRVAPLLVVEVVHTGEVPTGWPSEARSGNTTTTRTARPPDRADDHPGASGALVAGLDGCKAGWVMVAAPVDGGPTSVECITDLKVLLEALDHGRLMAAAIDIPIGLPDRGPRRCDPEARRLIGPRASSVFPAPVRGLLGSATYAEAASRCQAIDGKGLSQQAFAILPKIAAVDALMTPERQRHLVEVHPEVCFTVLSGRPMAHHKRKPEGRAERLAALRTVFPDVDAHAARRIPGTAPDDVLDAYVAAWSARRWLQGTYRRLGGELDGRGLRMEMIA